MGGKKECEMSKGAGEGGAFVMSLCDVMGVFELFRKTAMKPVRTDCS